MAFIITYKYKGEDFFRPAGHARTCHEIREIVSHFAILAEVSDIHIEETSRRLSFKLFTP